MELVERELFLRYALPCGKNLVKHGRISQSELDKGMGIDEHHFKVGLFMCEQAAKKLGKTVIDRDAIRQYFWFDHDRLVKEHELIDKSINPNLCIVYPGEYLGNGRVRTPVDERNVNISFVPNVKLGDYVTVHYNHICEIITKKEFDDLWNLKK